MEVVLLGEPTKTFFNFLFWETWVQNLLEIHDLLSWKIFSFEFMLILLIFFFLTYVSSHQIEQHIFCTFLNYCKKEKKRCIEKNNNNNWEVKCEHNTKSEQTEKLFRKGRGWLSGKLNAPRNGTSWKRGTFIRNGFKSPSNM